MLSLGIAERIEQFLRAHRGNPTLVLADEFDMIAGTSTGAIIAACLSWGNQDQMCRVLRQCEHGQPLDSEVGDLRECSLLPPSAKICKYARFNPTLLEPVRLDDVGRIKELLEIGRKYASSCPVEALWE